MRRRQLNCPEGTVCLAQVGRPFGVRGAFWLTSYTEPRDNIFRLAPLHLLRDDEPLTPITLRPFSASKRRKSGALVAISDAVTSREQAAELCNAQLLIHKKDLPPCDEDEFYFHELIGMKVMNQQGDPCGTVTDCYENGTSTAIVTISALQNDFSWDVPFRKEAVLAVDVKASTMTISDQWHQRAES